MNLYLVKVSEGTPFTYDTYDSAVVVAHCPEDALLVIPKPFPVSSELLIVKFLGKADPGLVSGELICGSFNAG